MNFLVAIPPALLSTLSRAVQSNKRKQCIEIKNFNLIDVVPLQLGFMPSFYMGPQLQIFGCVFRSLRILSLDLEHHHPL